MVTQLQLEIDSAVHKFLKERAKQDGVSVEGFIIRLIERYRRDADATGMTTRLVWDKAHDFEGRVSPDGRYLSYINWEMGNLAIRDFKTGENRDLHGRRMDATCSSSVSVKQMGYVSYGESLSRVANPRTWI